MSIYASRFADAAAVTRAMRSAQQRESTFTEMIVGMMAVVARGNRQTAHTQRGAQMRLYRVSSIRVVLPTFTSAMSYTVCRARRLSTFAMVVERMRWRRVMEKITR